MYRLYRHKTSDQGIVGSGPIASAPAASGYPAGVLWWDNVTGKIWQCDYAGNFVNNGLISLTDKVQTTSSFNPNNDFSLKISFRQDNDAVHYSGLFCQSVDGVGTNVSKRAIWLERREVSYNFIMLTASGSVIVNADFLNVVDGNWHIISVERAGSMLIGRRDGTQVFSKVINDTVNIPLYTSIGSQPKGRTINGQICCVEAISSSGSFKYRFNQTSGTIIQDLSGNGNTGTLTDGSPATFSGNKYWIPRELII